MTIISIINRLPFVKLFFVIMTNILKNPGSAEIQQSRGQKEAPLGRLFQFAAFHYFAMNSWS